MGYHSELYLEARSPDDDHWDRVEVVSSQPPIIGGMDPIRNPAALPIALAALRQLIAADNCNYERDTMRYCGMFRAARLAYQAATGVRLGKVDPYVRSAWLARQQRGLALARRLGMTHDR